MIINIYDTEKKYDIILADPAWQQTKGGKKQVRTKSSGTSLDYMTIPLDEIELILKQDARMVWNKVTGIPAAFTIRYGHEYLLYLYKGKLFPVAESERGKIHSVFTEQVKKHSKKPLESYRIINRLYPKQTKLELFARNHSEGFDCWGNEVNE